MLIPSASGCHRKSNQGWLQGKKQIETTSCHNPPLAGTFVPAPITIAIRMKYEWDSHFFVLHNQSEPDAVQQDLVKPEFY
jgi:hypothetical protein